MQQSIAQGMVIDLRAVGMTQVRIAKVLGCSQAEVSRWQHGKCRPGGELLMKLIDLHKEKVRIALLRKENSDVVDV